MRQKENGFTFVEVAIIAPIVILIIGTFIAIIVSMTGDVLTTRAKNELAADVHNTLARIENDVRTANAFLATNSITVTSPQGVNDDSTPFINADADLGDALILAKVASTSNPISPPTSYVYRQNAPGACDSPFLRQNAPIRVNIVYFIKQNSLWRRVIMASDYASSSCITPWQQPTCSPDVSDAFCSAADTELVQGVSAEDFTITYYENAGATVAIEAASDPSVSTNDRSEALQSAGAVVIVINATQTAAGKEFSWSGTRRIILPN